MFNTVTLIGYRGSDAKTSMTRNDIRLTVLSLATKRSWKNRESGEWESQTTWHRCVAFGPAAERASGLEKGSRVQVIGEIQNRSYVAKDGTTKHVTEIRVHRIVRLDRTPKSDNPEAAA